MTTVQWKEVALLLRDGGEEGQQLAALCRAHAESQSGSIESISHNCKVDHDVFGCCNIQCQNIKPKFVRCWSQ